MDWRDGGSAEYLHNHLKQPIPSSRQGMPGPSRQGRQQDFDCGLGRARGTPPRESRVESRRRRAFHPTIQVSLAGLCDSSSAIDMTTRMFVPGRRVFAIVISREFTGSFCHPWRLGPANPWRNDGSAEFLHNRLKQPIPSSRQGMSGMANLHESTETTSHVIPRKFTDPVISPWIGGTAGVLNIYTIT